jgi:hypothetical protein
MKIDDNDRTVTERVRQELDAGTSRLDAGTLGRLQEARLQAVAGARQGRPRMFFPLFVPRWVTAGGLAATAVVVVAVSFWAATPRVPMPVQPPDELEIVTSQEHLDLYADLEFYRWLADDRPH